MSDNDFLDAMSDVKPIEANQKINLQKNNPFASSFRARRTAAQKHQDKLSDPLADTEVAQLEHHALLDFCRPGVQHRVFKKLRLGRYSIDARLDLHRMTVEQSRQAVYHFVRDCMANDIRCSLIIHGLGKDRNIPPVLKSYVAHWLPQIKEVLAFHSAQPQHGGLGACYVLLKKSLKQRQENLEKHQRRK